MPPVLALSSPITVVLDVVAWGAVHASTGYLVHRMPAGRFERDGWLWRERAFEDGGRLYTRVFRVRRWKRWLPEAGDLFRGGFDKSRLRSRSPEYLRRYVGETRRAELGHVLAASAAPLFFLWNPWAVGVFMVVYAIAVNAPCVISQRYNRLRLVRLLRGARQEG